jgi:hypothetical protein
MDKLVDSIDNLIQGQMFPAKHIVTRVDSVFYIVFTIGGLYENDDEFIQYRIAVIGKVMDELLGYFIPLTKFRISYVKPKNIKPKNRHMGYVTYSDDMMDGNYINYNGY